ncbi:replication-relaxation family protein [Cryobacterium sp. 10S3]|uniref:replication-relaxation family protein n=1 Tax=Cryobacterium sp. 10S3 TaxID=3048582 RepID=UPI002AC8A2A1|nr:replication-relaxation family protein [Cryobacterium sp. 10S3]MEB0287209.1 replication-relaxation family protein [Cryobacterium sp. 10S3]WPX14164.1 replication-relaxation family protein [Cryobacterium sp. 10S3]
MPPLDRDHQIVLSVARFGQLTSGHLADMHFSDLASPTPLKRAVIRLVASKHLAIIERRPTGGTGAGSGQRVLQLGSAGWTFARREGRYWPYRTINLHTLAIVDAYVELTRLERLGRIRIDGFSTEPDSWFNIAGADIRPDITVDVSGSFPMKSIRLWIEIDMGTERQKAIKDKLERYWYGYVKADNGELDDIENLQVLFIAPDDARARELRWIIERGDKDAQALFMVSKLSEFAGLMFG